MNKRYRLGDIEEAISEMEELCKNQGTGERGDTEAGQNTGNARVFRNCDTL